MSHWLPPQAVPGSSADDLAHATMATLRDIFEASSRSERLAFIDAIEAGTPVSDPDFREIAQVLRVANDERREAVRSFHGEPFRHFVLDYSPDVLVPVDCPAARKFYESKIKTSHALLKHRSVPTARGHVEAGFHLLSDNPVDYFLLLWRLMDRFVADQCHRPERRPWLVQKIPWLARRKKWQLIGAFVFFFLTAVTFGRWIIQPPRYQGMVSEARGTGSGLVIDLDGRYPNQKMTVWIPGRVFRDFMQSGGQLPQPGWFVIVTGATTQYRGHPEIVVNDVSTQMRWWNPNDPESQ